MPDQSLPPPERDHRRAGSFVGMAVLWVITMVAVVEFAFLLSSHLKEENAFITKCIEFHSESRCRDLLKYDRQDLMMRPDR
jgi:hypothetical protein